jgi:hypothetical protein
VRRVSFLPPAFGRTPASGGSFGSKLFIEAHASISVLSTEKCSLKREIKQGRIPAEWAKKPAKLRQKDRDAR